MSTARSVEAHAAAGAAQVCHRPLGGGDPRRAEGRDESRHLAVAVERQGILDERDPSEAPPTHVPGGRAHPAHHEGEEIGRIGESARLPRRVHAREDLGAQDPDARRVVVEACEAGRVGLEEHRREPAAGVRLEADVGTDQELPRRRRPRRVALQPRRGCVAHRTQRTEAAGVGPPECRSMGLNPVDEIREPRETGEHARRHDEGCQRDRVRHRGRAGPVPMEQLGRGLGRLHGAEQLAPPRGSESRDARRGQLVQGPHGSRIIDDRAREPGPP